MLSVIIPSYNAASTLGDQLDALRAQEFEGEWEVVVVDNRSSDHTGEVVKLHQAMMPNLRYVQALERQGEPYARNVGVQAAKGDAVLFCDADDVVARGWLNAMAGALQQHDFVASTIELDRLNQRLSWYPKPPNWATERGLAFLPFAGGALIALSRAAFQRVGGFSEQFLIGCDIDISWRLQLLGYALHAVPTAFVHVRYRDNTRGMLRQTLKFGEAHVHLYKHFAKHGMPRSSVRRAFREYKALAKTGLKFRNLEQQQRMECLYRLAARLGRLIGSLRYFTLYL